MSENSKLKTTRQRRVIMEVLKSTRSHPTAEWVYSEARKQISNISLGTVYRNLSILSENGHILKLDFGQGEAHYDGFTHPHVHLMCESCQRIFDLPISGIDCDRNKIEKETGFSIHEMHIEMRGVCPECKRTK
ncbi:MAG TPA: transcriptional repressor [Caldisericia bacterium]|nr:transcriptional repressor [Caldisericia bacterium]HPF49409.1 transcriptional repressor [Caldisericia bacterium]HPI84388.1 transcriptional repressor [Caldisericia bacterium]HPQ93580.1 transcriptional repressor [Caldisericia bacterium]HRV75549.1 transcriptional repressor [Caldisericia bacterium]